MMSANDDTNDANGARERKQTEQGQQYTSSMKEKFAATFMKQYEQWKELASITKKSFKGYMTPEDVKANMQNHSMLLDKIRTSFEDYRRHGVPDTLMKRRMDICTDAVAKIQESAQSRLQVAQEEDIDVLSLSSFQTKSSMISKSSKISALSNAVNLEAQFKAKEEEAKKKDELERLELQNKYIAAKEAKFLAEIEAQQAERDAEYARKKRELELLETRHKAEQARALADAMSEEELFSDVESKLSEKTPTTKARSFKRSQIREDSLVEALSATLSLNRLPAPEPFVFDGDPLKYNEWRAAFRILIDDKRGVSTADKLFFLQRYCSKEVKSILSGYFICHSDNSYQAAWKALDSRYGDSFIIAEAFREKLQQWPKISPKDSKALLSLSDYLVNCEAAMTTIEELNILNDPHENRKLLQKLPDWLVSRWNRQVEEIRESGKPFPKFAEFVKFIKKEAKIATNPITSWNALHKMDADKERTKFKSKTLVTTTNGPSKGCPENFKRPCLYCKVEGCHINKCEKFSSQNMEEKLKFVKEQRLCFGCLRQGHSSKDCKRRASCQKCSKRHPTQLHDDARSSDGRTQISEPAVPLIAATNRRVEATNTSMIVPVWVATVDNPEEEVLVYALLDTQSDTTFIVSEVAAQLNTKGDPVELKLTTLTTQNKRIPSERIKGLQVRGFRSKEIIPLPPAYTQDYIPVDRSQIPTRQTAIKWPHLKPMASELPPIQGCGVGLLIGFNCPDALIPVRVVTGNFGEPFAQKTSLGWSIVGCQNPCIEQEEVVGQAHRITTCEVPPLTIVNILESDFKVLEGPKVSQEDLQFLNQVSNIKQDGSHYSIPLPFKATPDLPCNKKLAEIRLEHLRDKFNKNKAFKEDYITFMQDVISKGDAEVAPTTESKGKTWYIPHHGVYHPKKQKIRVVFDCSARFRGHSLNDHLLTGPDLTNALVGVLIRFRMYKYAITCDVEKMFHQFKIPEDQRDFFRFLWWEDLDNLQSKPIEYRMKVHIFGAASSPGCANYGLKTIAERHAMPNQSAASHFIKRNFYVDDGLGSKSTLEEAKRLVADSSEVCRKGGLRLHKFVSNFPQVLEDLPQSERAQNVTDFNLSETLTERTLGIKWLVKEDKFSFTLIPDTTSSRRGVLSTVASLYDPLGFVAPFCLIGKVILQKMCVRKLFWDDKIPEDLAPSWEKWKRGLSYLPNVKIPRCYELQGLTEPYKVELHNFSDASTVGYGQCSYLRLIDQCGNVQISLVMAKSRVAPSKITTIPRLELTAAVLSVKVARFLQEELEYKDMDVLYWTDSKVVLGYINNEAKRFHVFVANRVQQIRQHSEVSQWFYVPTRENPADHASRGLEPEQIMTSNWLTGPKFLWNSEFTPQQEEHRSLLPGDPEVKVVHKSSTVASSPRLLQTELPCTDETKEHIVPESQSPPHNSKNWLPPFENFSSWTTLVRAIARIKRRAKGNKDPRISTVGEREEAVKHILLLVQQEEHREFLSSQGKRGQSSLQFLSPIIDTEGLIRIGSRLANSDLSDEARHPIVIPKNHPVSSLIIAHFHDKCNHQGRGMTLNEIRQNGFWIVNGSKQVASVIHKCVKCRKMRRQPETQLMACLPKERSQESPPFSFCGMDCFGPFLIKEGRKEHKKYGVLFTCFASRAIHIEMLDDLTTDAFINAFRCFLALRGPVKQMRSDQGTNFIGAKNEFTTALKRSKPQLQGFLADNNCEFLLNPPNASHMGGAWERQIRTVRSILEALVNNLHGRLDSSSLRTFFYEAMATVNSRPLTATDSESIEPLTPNHLITMKGKTLTQPPGVFVKEDLYARKRWRRVQYLSQQFWSRWRKEYLTNLHLRQKWRTPRRNLQVGDITLLVNDDQPRNVWSLARVIEAVPDSDGYVRKVKVQIKEDRGMDGKRRQPPTVLERPIQKLVLLVEGNN